MVENRGIDAVSYVRLSLPVNTNTRRGEDPAIITATGLRTVVVDRTLVIDQHGAVPIIPIAHEHVTFWEAGGRKQQPAGNSLDGLRFFRPDVDEHRRAAARGAVAARYRSFALSGSQR